MKSVMVAVMAVAVVVAVTAAEADPSMGWPVAVVPVAACPTYAAAQHAAAPGSASAVVAAELARVLRGRGYDAYVDTPDPEGWVTADIIVVWAHAVQGRLVRVCALGPDGRAVTVQAANARLAVARLESELRLPPPIEDGGY